MPSCLTGCWVIFEGFRAGSRKKCIQFGCYHPAEIFIKRQRTASHESSWESSWPGFERGEHVAWTEGVCKNWIFSSLYCSIIDSCCWALNLYRVISRTTTSDIVANLSLLWPVANSLVAMNGLSVSVYLRKVLCLWNLMNEWSFAVWLVFTSVNVHYVLIVFVIFPYLFELPASQFSSPNVWIQDEYCFLIFMWCCH